MSTGDGIVVGASSGVGLALAERLAAGGSTVTALSRRGTGASAPDVRNAAADIRDFRSLERAVADAAERHAVDFVVNCAGVGFYAPIGDDHSEVWNDILATNVTGVLNLVSVVERRLPELPSLVHVSSMAAYRVSTTPGNLCYSVAKGAARTVVEDYRRMVRGQGRATRVMMVSPGFIEGTEFGERFFSRAPSVQPVDLYGAHANLTAGDVAGLIQFVLDLPPHMEVGDLTVRPTKQPA